jgi:predicted RNA binding protein YcfA (HicA-like mRNA interferase family)
VARLVPLPARKVLRALEQLGFHAQHQRGSHPLLKHPDGRTTLIPIHPSEDIRPGLLRKIIRGSGVTVEEFLERT